MAKGMIDDIKRIISKEFWNQNWTSYGLAKEARTDRRTLNKFLYEDGDIKLEPLCNICEALGLELVIRKKEN